MRNTRKIIQELFLTQQFLQHAFYHILDKATLDKSTETHYTPHHPYQNVISQICIENDKQMKRLFDVFTIDKLKCEEEKVCLSFLRFSMVSSSRLYCSHLNKYKQVH